MDQNGKLGMAALAQDGNRSANRSWRRCSISIIHEYELLGCLRRISEEHDVCAGKDFDIIKRVELST